MIPVRQLGYPHEEDTAINEDKQQAKCPQEKPVLFVVYAFIMYRSSQQKIPYKAIRAKRRRDDEAKGK